MRCVTFVVGVGGGVADASGGLGGVLDLVTEIGGDDVVVAVEGLALEGVLGVWVSGLERVCDGVFSRLNGVTHPGCCGFSD